MRTSSGLNIDTAAATASAESGVLPEGVTSATVMTALEPSFDADDIQHNNAAPSVQEEANTSMTGLTTSSGAAAAVKGAFELDVFEKKTIGALTVQYIVNSCSQTGLFPSTLSSVQDHFGVNHTAMTFLVAVYDGLQMVASVAVPRLGAVHGMPNTIAVGAILGGLGNLFYAGAVSYWMLVISQFLTGIGSACLIVLCPPMLNRALGCRKNGSLWLGAVYALSSLGVIAGYIAAGIFDPVQCWRIMFAVCAVAFIVPAFQMRDMQRHEDELRDVGNASPTTSTAPTEMKPESAAETAAGSKRGSPDKIPTDEFGPGDSIPALEDPAPTWGEEFKRASGPIKEVLANKTVFWGIMSMSASSFYLSAFIALLPKFIEVELEAGKSKASLIVALTIPAATGSIAFSGYMSKHRSHSIAELVWLLVVSNGITIPMQLIFFVKNLTLFSLGLPVFLFAGFFTAVPAMSIFPYALPARVAPYANGLSNFIVRLLGSIPGPLLLGVLLDTNMKPNHAYALVGALGTMTATATAYVAYRTVRNESKAKADEAETKA